MHTIELFDDDSSLLGYVIEPHEHNIFNYLSDHYDAARAELVQTAIEEFGRPVALLRNMHVDEICRGQGIGSQLLKQFLSEASQFGAGATLLAADTLESQADGFDIVAWYARHGLTVVDSFDQDLPLMAAPERFAHRLAEIASVSTPNPSSRCSPY